MKVLTDVETIGTSQAMKYLDALYDHQRPLSQSHVDYLAKQMTDGAFDPTAQVAFAVMRPDGPLMLINGQHTLWAIVESDTEQTLPVITYEVDTPLDIARIYSHFDIGRGRNFADAVRAYGTADSIGITDQQIIRLGGALRHILSGFPRTKPDTRFPNERIIKETRNWQKEALSFFELISPGDIKMKSAISRAAPMAVMLVILRYCPEDGPSFLEQVVIDDGLRLGDPRKTLHRYIRDLSSSTRTGKTVELNGQIARVVAKCWDKFRSGSSLKRAYVIPEHAGNSIVIKGTPYGDVEHGEK